MFILRRFLAFIPVALIVALIVFLMLHLSPGDPVAAIAGDSATAADIARIRAELGLDDPLPEQFVRWCMELIQGDLGRSYFLNRPVADLIADRVGPTLSLAGFTIVLTVLIAVPLGAWAAYRQGGWVDRALMGFSVLGFSIPSFVLGYCFVWLFGLKLNLLPSQGYVRYDESIEGWISHLILPSLTLCCIYVALIARVTRASVAEMLTEDFIRIWRRCDAALPLHLFCGSLRAFFCNRCFLGDFWHPRSDFGADCICRGSVNGLCCVGCRAGWFSLWRSLFAHLRYFSAFGRQFRLSGDGTCSNPAAVCTTDCFRCWCWLFGIWVY